MLHLIKINDDTWWSQYPDCVLINVYNTNAVFWLLFILSIFLDHKIFFDGCSFTLQKHAELYSKLNPVE